MSNSMMLTGEEPEQVKNKGGRPSTKPVDFESLSEPERVLYTYMNGGFDSAVCKAVEISKEEFDTRYKEDDEFRRMISFGRTMCQAWWEGKYKEAAEGNNKINASMVNFAMKNMFGWAEKSETTNTDIMNIEGMTRDDAMQKLRSLGPNILDLIEAKARKTA